MSLLPVRCFSCGGMVASKYPRYRRARVEEKMPERRALDAARLRRACCRALVLGYREHLETRREMAAMLRH